MIGDRPILSHLVLASHPRSNFSLVRLAPWNTTSAPTTGVLVLLKRREKIGIGHEDTPFHSSQTSG